MMRALLSVTTLLLVVFLVMKLSASQWRTLAPAGPDVSAATSAAASAAASAANRSATSTNAAQQAAQRVQQAIDQGAAQRAEDAASR